MDGTPKEQHDQQERYHLILSLEQKLTSVELSRYVFRQALGIQK